MLPEDKYSVYIKNIPLQVKNGHIQQLFKHCGEINRINIKKGYAFVGFETKEA
jgi:RNA recognition motif-containing protein